MKNKIFSIYLFSVISAGIINSTFGQVTLDIVPGSSVAYCPKVQIDYSVKNISGNKQLPTCQYTWEIQKGRFFNGENTGSTVTVIWDDTPGNRTLKVKTSNCSYPSGPEHNNLSKTKTYTILSVTGQSFSIPQSTIQVPYCQTASVDVSVGKMYVQGTGGFGPPKKEVDRYNWTVPKGWTVQATGIPGPTTHSQTSNVITLIPSGTEDGDLKVQGSLNETCIGNYGSNFGVIKLIRTPTITITSPGYGGPRCGLKKPVQFTAASVPPCVQAYTWSFPSGWQGTSSTNSITLTPSGTTADEGDLSLSIKLTSGKTIVKKYVLDYEDTPPPLPAISTGNSYTEMCPGDTWTFTCTPPPGYPTDYGFDWYVEGAALSVNGVLTSQNSLLHTATNSVSVHCSSSAYGTAYVRVRLSTPGCSPSAYITRQTRAGVYNSNEFSIIGSSNVCPNTVQDYLTSYINSDILDYKWTVPSGWSSSGQGTPYLSVSIPTYFTGGAITLRLKNRCGYTNTPHVLPLFSGYGCGYGYSFGPNPATKTLTITATDFDNEIEAKLFDHLGKYKILGTKKLNQIEFDVENLPDGQYVLQVTSKDRMETQNIIISHR